MTLASVAAYREAMAGFAQMGRLEVWYAHLTEEELLEAMRRAAKGAKTKKPTNAARRGREGRQEGLVSCSSESGRSPVSLHPGD